MLLDLRFPQWKQNNKTQGSLSPRLWIFTYTFIFSVFFLVLFEEVNLNIDNFYLVTYIQVPF